MGAEHKITGILQLIAVSVVILYILTDGTIPRNIALIAVAFFIVKGIGFTFMKQNLLSLSDTIAGIYLLLPVLGIFSNTILNIIFIGWLIQKGIIYLFR
ncbi:MAG: hypothetical protein HYW22_02130 [Candidatus Aenigmarchaeota archaeon]|nr:hypothetical protein [Candidatus Aenigmarchaeota archaeon]